ncbi:MAG: hypothetical protein C0505_05915 [Leptothrix sp. (in: Bacteria)]|nr:hypothetical protein [Leptothrix sp. (in: b-proteobacteria)]
MFRSFAFPARWSRRSTLCDRSRLRAEACPPSLRFAPAGGAWQRAMFWLLAPSPRAAAMAPDRLPDVRSDFLGTLADIAGDEADALRCRIREARTLRELWHARAEVYRIVGVAHSQGLAEERLGLLNRHFPTRAPRSQFAPL